MNNNILKNKKVGILTFHNALNYGAILQAYGLHKAIKKLDYDVEIIDYKNEILEKQYSFKRFFNMKKGILRFIFDLVEMPFWFTRKIKFDNFLKKEMNISKRFYKIDEKVENLYYRLIVGSDQVWNYKITGLDDNYFFGNVKDKNKINSYAASFGFSDIPKEYEHYYTENLKNFNNISIRETQGKKIIEKLINKNVDIVVDPTLLLSKEEWNKDIGIKNCNEDYILIYQLAYSKKLIKFAENLSKKTGYKIITINGNPRQLIKAKYVLGAGPNEWLSLFYNAKYIVTNSFHGLAFSINFNKSFFVALLDEKLNLNSRLENLIEYFELRDRIILDENIIDLSREINYYEINKKLELFRESSFRYLKNILS